MTKSSIRELVQHAIDTGELLSSPQAAEICEVTTNTIAHWIKEGKLLGIKLPQFGDHHLASEWLIVRSDLYAFQATREEFTAQFNPCGAGNDFVEGTCIREKGHTGLHRAGKSSAVTWKDRDPGSHKHG